MNFNEKSNEFTDDKISSSTNIFSEQDFAQSEDIILVIENTPAFYNMDIPPDRFSVFINFLKQFIDDRIKIDYRDRYFLYIFSQDVTSSMLDFENFSQTLITHIHQGFESSKSQINIDEKTWSLSFINALQKAIQKCIASFKAIRNKTLRILIFVNELPSLPATFNTQVQQVIERTAQRLDIIIDVVHIIGSKSISIFDSTELYKMIGNMTGGNYYQIKNNNDFNEIFKEITPKKKILLKQYVSAREYTQEKQFLEVIASDMERITDLMTDTDLKCQICFQKRCTCEIVDDYQHIRRCPNCNKVLHMCCSGKWAEQQNSKSNFIGFPNVFRCPYCFYLLKVPREFVNFDSILYQLQEKWLKQKETEERERKEQEKKEKEVHEFVEVFKQQQSERENIIQWLTVKLPQKTPREINRIADDLEILPNREEKVNFLNYLKFKEKIKDDTLPI